jgi:hypothetical protein
MPTTKNDRMTIHIQTSDRMLGQAARDEIAGQDIEIEELLIKADPSNLTTIFFTVVGGAATRLLAQWLYDKLKKNSDQKLVINGNHISGSNIQIGQITQIFISEQKREGDSNPEQRVSYGEPKK